MDAKDIARVLLRHYCNYNYKLFNTNVFAWESDFFAISDSGYVTEIETKISRGDYFRDFFKEKHRLFKALQSKRKYIVQGWDTKGDFLCDEVRYKEMQIRFEGKKIGYNDQIVSYNYDYNKQRDRYIVNDYNDARLKLKIIPAFYAKATHIMFKEVGNQNAPHKFYFACPEKLIKPEEVPAYAGLLYISDNAIEVVKSAPFLHKNKMELTAILLKKFYNLWQYRATLEEKIQTVKDEDSSRENESAA